MLALIKRGLEENPSYTTEDVIRGLAAGFFHLHREEQGIAITKFSGFRDKRLLVFLLAGENLDEWKGRMDAKLSAFAVANGCSCIEAYCRPGLKKSLKDLDWKVEQLVMRKTINGK